MNYETRLANLELPTLEDRRRRGDLIQQFKFVKKVNTVNWFYGTLSGNGRDPVRPGTRAFNRSHQYQMNSQFTRIDRRVHFFTNRVVNDWNELTSNVVSTETVNMFKNRLNKFQLF